MIRYEANLICEDLGGFLMEPKTEEIQVTCTHDNFAKCTFICYESVYLGLALIVAADATWPIW